MSRRLAQLKLAGVLVAGLLAIGCMEGSSGTAPGTGRLTLKLTDAPFPFDSVSAINVFVVRVDGQVADAADNQAQNDGDPGNNTDPSKGWVTLAEPNQVFDILQLTNGKTADLGDASLPTGNYAGFRIILDTDKSSVTLKDGTVLNGNSTPGIKWPSAGHSGIKIVLDAPVDLVEGTTTLVIDFDIGQSFVMRGHTISQNGLLFKPVVKATAHVNAGSVAGTVHQDSETGATVADATVELIKAGTAIDDTVSANIIRSGKTDADGKFDLTFLAPGTYDIRAFPPSALTGNGPVLKTGITVTLGVETGGVVLVLPKK
jgi:hypothetical protein